MSCSGYGQKTYEALKNNSTVNTLVGGRISPLVRAEGEAVPAIVYTVVSDPTLHGLDSHGLNNARVQVDCYAESYEGAQTLASAVSTALTVKAGGFTSLEWDRREDYEDETELYRVSIDFSQWITEA